jgi:hypothetical protein
LGESGEWVSNAWVTYLQDRDNSSKGGLILDDSEKTMFFQAKAYPKDTSPEDGPGSYQLVGEVKAYQGYDR